MSCETYDISLAETQAPATEPGRRDVTYTATYTADGEPYFANTATYSNLPEDLTEVVRLGIAQNIVAVMMKKGFRNVGTSPKEVRYEGLDFAGMKLFEKSFVKLAEELTNFGETRNNLKKPKPEKPPKPDPK